MTVFLQSQYMQDSGSIYFSANTKVPSKRRSSVLVVNIISNIYLNEEQVIQIFAEMPTHERFTVSHLLCWTKLTTVFSRLHARRRRLRLFRLSAKTFSKRYGETSRQLNVGSLMNRVESGRQISLSSFELFRYDCHANLPVLVSDRLRCLTRIVQNRFPPVSSYLFSLAIKTWEIAVSIAAVNLYRCLIFRKGLVPILFAYWNYIIIDCNDNNISLFFCLSSYRLICQVEYSQCIYNILLSPFNSLLRPGSSLTDCTLLYLRQKLRWISDENAVLLTIKSHQCHLVFLTTSVAPRTYWSIMYCIVVYHNLYNNVILQSR